MKFKCNRTKLTEAVTNVQRAVSSKSTNPALEGILIEAEKNKLKLYGYDMEICITTTIEAKVEKEGASVITAKLVTSLPVPLVVGIATNLVFLPISGNLYVLFLISMNFSFNPFISASGFS